MPTFKYQAYDRQGAKFKGEVQADTKNSALVDLQNQGMMVRSLTEKLEISGTQLSFGKQKVSLQDLEYLTSELSLLLKNGVKIDKGLAIISQNSQVGPVGKLVNNLLTGVRRGLPLSETMQNEGDIFSALYVNLVRLGEASGNLPMVFDRLSKDLRFQRELRDKIIQALTYPMIIFMVCVLCIVFVFNYIVPQMSGLFSGISDLPDYTVALLNVSAWFQQYQWFALIGIVGSVIALLSLRKRPKWQARFSAWSMKTPLFKTMLLFAEQIRFNSALAMMSESGVVLDKAMALAAESISNSQLKQDMLVAQQKIRKGTRLSEALSRSPLFPSFSISLLEVGEESGDLSPVFDELSSRSKTQFENAINKITSVLEPLLILVMGGIVGSVVVTMLLSIVAVNDIGF